MIYTHILGEVLIALVLLLAEIIVTLDTLLVATVIMSVTSLGIAIVWFSYILMPKK
jgi:hypothetical protein